MVDSIDGFDLASLKQALTLPFQIVTQRIPRQLTHREFLSNPSSRLAQTMHGKARKEPIRWVQNPCAVHGHPGRKIAVSPRAGQVQRYHPSLRTTNLCLAYIEQLRLLAHRNHRGVTQIRRTLQQQRVVAHVRNWLLSKFEYLDRSELRINRPPFCQRLPAF